MPDPADGGLESRWTEVALRSDLPPEGTLAVDAGGRRLLLGVTDGGLLFAVSDQCPHEGYPLRQGFLRGCVLTCAWHNWKFDVRDGSGLLGGEGVRTWPARAVDDRIEVDLAEPPPELAIPSLLASLRAGMRDGALERCLRDGVRLLQAGHPPAAILVEVARYDALHAEYGTTHVLPVCADLLGQLDRFAGLDAIHVLTPALRLACEVDRRLPPRPRSVPVDRGDRAAVLRIIEQENVELAEAVVRGLSPRGGVEPMLFAAAAQHFTDFGHSLIYLVKLRSLAAVADDATVADLRGAWAVSLAQATREDTLPYLRRYFRTLDEREDRLPELHGLADPAAPFAGDALRDAVLEGSAAEACGQFWSAVEGGVDAARIAAALVSAAAHRLLRFDLEIELDGDVAEGWLWASHRLTFASAVREAVDCFDEPGALRLLLQAVAFVHSGRKMDAPEERRPTIAPRDGSPEELRAALDRRDVEGVLALVAAWRPEHAAVLLDVGLGDRHVRPMNSAHAFKTMVAALAERRAGPDGLVPVLAAARMLASPVVEQRSQDLARRARRFVVEGHPVRKLTQ